MTTQQELISKIKELLTKAAEKAMSDNATDVKKLSDTNNTFLHTLEWRITDMFYRSHLYNEYWDMLSAIAAYERGDLGFNTVVNMFKSLKLTYAKKATGMARTLSSVSTNEGFNLSNRVKLQVYLTICSEDVMVEINEMVV